MNRDPGRTRQTRPAQQLDEEDGNEEELQVMQEGKVGVVGGEPYADRVRDDCETLRTLSSWAMLWRLCCADL